MTTALDKFDKFVSLGYVCTVSSMLMRLRKRTKTQVFDYMAIPAWAISELLTNNFEQIFDPANMELKVLFDNSDKEYLTDTRYNIRLPFDDYPSHKFENYEESKSQRAVRLHSLLSAAETNGESLLFIRHEEPQHYADLGNRIPNPAHTAKYAQSELYWLQQISQTIKTKYPSLDFKILFFNSAGEMVNDNIVGISLPDCDYREGCAGGKMIKKLQDHSLFLETNL